MKLEIVVISAHFYILMLLMLNMEYSLTNWSKVWLMKPWLLVPPVHQQTCVLLLWRILYLHHCAIWSVKKKDRKCKYIYLFRKTHHVKGSNFPQKPLVVIHTHDWISICHWIVFDSQSLQVTYWFWMSALYLGYLGLMHWSISLMYNNTSQVNFCGSYIQNYVEVKSYSTRSTYEIFYWSSFDKIHYILLYLEFDDIHYILFLSSFQ